MSDAEPASPGPDNGRIEHGELVDQPAESAPALEGDAVTSPAKVMRIGSMVKMLLEEVRAAPLDEASRERLAARQQLEQIRQLPPGQALPGPPGQPPPDRPGTYL
jgi:hypothetical protein